jgi:signal transduction histidine kinase
MDIFYLHYRRPLPDGVPAGWLIGCYSSLRKAEEAQARMKIRPGYREHPDGFSVTCHRLDTEYDDPSAFSIWDDHDARPSVWLNQLVPTAIGTARVFSKSKASIEMAADDKGVWAKADPQQLGTVVAHLLANGLEAVGETGRVQVTLDWLRLAAPRPRLHVQLPRPVPTGLYARLIVSDNGCGMDDEVQSRMFQPLFSTKGAGRGMGLALVYDIAGSNGWWLDVRSAPGTGTDLTLYFPCRPRVARGQTD